MKNVLPAPVWLAFTSVSSVYSSNKIHLKFESYELLTIDWSVVRTGNRGFRLTPAIESNTAIPGNSSIMSIIGIDFGSHTASFAIWYEDKNVFEVLADDLGSRTIPSAVAFRGDEIITGQAAVSQRHKNASNTFEDIRALILNPDVQTVHVPLLDKDITVQELASHFFRNIHNQIKQQVGKPLRDCVVSVPYKLDDAVKKRLVEAAQAGGMRIKAVVEDTVCAMLAHQLDDASTANSGVLVADIGWSRTAISLYTVSGGLFFPVSSEILTECSGNTFVNLLATHCAKDFTRKNKVPLEENKRSMMRLKTECENAMKSLSTGAEATIDIDSLCEGIDYSFKLSRARFEDIIAIPLMHLKNVINSALSKASWTSSNISVVCLSGGGAGIPKVSSILKTQFPAAKFPAGRFEIQEAPSVGAVLHGKYLFQLGLLDNAPAVSPVATVTTRTIRLVNVSADQYLDIVPANSVLPASVTVPVSLTEGQTSGFVRLVLATAEAADPDTVLAELALNETAGKLVVNVSADGAIEIVVQTTESGDVISSLQISAAV